MISKSETVSDIAKDFERESRIHRMCKSGSMSMWQATKYALRFQAAHEREVKVLRECLNEAVFVMQTLFDKQMPKWRKALEGEREDDNS